MKLSYLLAAAITLLAAVVPLQAQPYPYKPIRLIVPFRPAAPPTLRRAPYLRR